MNKLHLPRVRTDIAKDLFYCNGCNISAVICSFHRQQSDAVFSPTNVSRRYRIITPKNMQTSNINISKKTANKSKRRISFLLC